MKFCWTTVHVKNMEASMRFYHQVLDLPIVTQIQSESMEMVMLGTEGNALVELIYDGNMAVTSHGISMGFMVESLEDAMALMQQEQINIAAGPFAPHPGIRFFFVKDPDGVSIQIVEQK